MLNFPAVKKHMPKLLLPPVRFAGKRKVDPSHPSAAGHHFCSVRSVAEDARHPQRWLVGLSWFNSGFMMVYGGLWWFIMFYHGTFNGTFNGIPVSQMAGNSSSWMVFNCHVWLPEGNNVVKTMPCLPPMTGNGLYIPPINGDDWGMVLWHCFTKNTLLITINHYYYPSLTIINHH